MNSDWKRNNAETENVTIYVQNLVTNKKMYRLQAQKKPHIHKP